MWGSVEGCFVYTAPGVGEPIGETLETNDLQTFYGSLALPASQAAIPAFSSSILPTEDYVATPTESSKLPRTIMPTAPYGAPKMSSDRPGTPPQNSSVVPTIHVAIPSAADTSVLPVKLADIPTEPYAGAHSLGSTISPIVHTTTASTSCNQDIFTQLHAASTVLP